MLQGRENWREYEANLEKIKRIFINPLFKNCLLVDLQGGEPLLVEDLDRIVVYLTERGHITNVSTNGLLLAERISDLKRAGISRINLSLCDENRSIIERDLARVNQIFPVHTSFVLLRSSVERQQDKLLELARFVRDAGSLSLRLLIYQPRGINPKPEEIITDDNPAYLEFRSKIEERLPGFCLWPATLQTGLVKKQCPQLWQRISSDMLGNMEICCGTDATLQGANSNLFASEPDSLFNHPTLIRMRQQLLDPGSEPPDICKSCSLLGNPGW
jgi:hypothetical protein